MEKDAFGQQLLAAYEGRDAVGILERSDGRIETHDGAGYFLGIEHWSQPCQNLMPLAGESVLDLGCGAGRHLIYLQEKGHQVAGIDLSFLAVEVCHRRGLKTVQKARFDKLPKSMQGFDSIIMLGNNFGLFGSRNKAIGGLKMLAKRLNPDGNILAEVLNPYLTKDLIHLRYHEANRQKGRMGGQIRIRTRYAHFCDPWFDYLFVSPDELLDIVEETPFKIGRVLTDNGPVYGMELILR